MNYLGRSRERRGTGGGPPRAARTSQARDDGGGGAWRRSRGLLCAPRIRRLQGGARRHRSNRTRDLRHGGRRNFLGNFATAEQAALAVARFLGPEGAPRRARPQAPRRLRGAGPSAPPSKRGKQPADDDDEVYVVTAEAVSDDDDDAPTPPAPAPPVLCYCERLALLDGRWVCAQLVEGDFCILGREDE